MNMFGLGVVINATDNMSKGFMTALNTLNDFEERIDRVAHATQSGISEIELNMMKMNNLSLTGMGLQEFGSQISGVGQAMLSPFVQFGQQITATGNQFENYRLTLKALYGDVNEASSKINEAMDLAAKTPFQLEDVMGSVIGFKALGVEVLDTMEDVTGESRTLLEYIGDLASLRPDVGLEGMLYGIRNLLGGDGGRSLRSRLDMDFEQMLGFEWADTTEGMIEQIVMASQQIANGLMKEMEGSWSHMTSNLEDQWDKFKLAVSDAGAFDSVKNTLKYFYDIIDAIDEDKMATIGKNISSAFNMLWKPIDLIARGLGKVIQTVINLVAESPMLTKVLTGFTAISGTVLVLVGAMTMLGGSVLIAYAGFKGLQILFTKLPVFVMTALPKLASAITMFGKFALVGGALYLAWKSDFMGVRTVLQTFMNNVATAFSESSRISKLGVDDMLSALKQLDTTTFGGWLTYRLTQIRVFWIALCDAWNDYTLSDENFQKVQALGLLPLLETILDLKMKAEAFFKGFKEGWETVNAVVSPIIQWIGDKLSDLIDFLFPVEDGIKNINSENDKLNLDKWERMGNLVAQFAYGLMLGLGIFKIVSFVGSVIGGIVKVFSVVGGVITFVWDAIGLIVTGISVITGLSVGWVVAIIAGLALLVVGFIKYKDEIIEIAGKVLGGIASVIAGVVTGVLFAIMSIGVAITTFFMLIGGVVGTVCGVIAGVIATVALTIQAVFQSALEIVKALFLTAFETIKGIVCSIIGVVTTVMLTFQGIIDTALAIVKGIFDTVIAVIKAVWTGDFSSLGETIKSIWSGVGEKIKEIWSNVSEKVTEIWGWVKSQLSEAFNGIKEAWGTAMDNISEIASNCVTAIQDVWGSIGTFFSDMWQGIMNSASSLFTWLADKFSWVTTTVGAVQKFFNWGGGDVKVETNVPKPKVGLNTGGFVKDEGVAMLHPNEVVINDDLTRKLRTFLTENETESPQGRSVGLNNIINNDNIYNNYINNSADRGVDVSPITNVLTRFVDNVSNFFSNPLEITIPEFNYPVPTMLSTDNSESVETPVSYNTTNNEETNNSSNVYNNMTSTLANTTNKNSHTNVSNDYSVTFDKGAIQITVENGNDTDVEKIAQQIMLKIKRQQQLDNTRNYKPSF